MYGVFTTPISHERPPRLNDHFLAYKGVVVQARDYCITKCTLRVRLDVVCICIFVASVQLVN